MNKIFCDQGICECGLFEIFANIITKRINDRGVLDE